MRADDDSVLAFEELSDRMPWHHHARFMSEDALGFFVGRCFIEPAVRSEDTVRRCRRQRKHRRGPTNETRFLRRRRVPPTPAGCGNLSRERGIVAGRYDRHQFAEMGRAVRR